MTFYALNEYFGDVNLADFRTMKRRAELYSAAGATPIILTKTSNLTAYAQAMPNFLLGAKPSFQTGEEMQPAAIDRWGNSLAMYLRQYKGAALVLDWESFAGGYWTNGGLPRDAIVRFIARVRESFAGELWWYPMLHWSSKTPDVRLSCINRFASIVAAYDESSRFVDLELDRPRESDAKPTGRQHSAWHTDCALLRTWLRRLPLSIGYPSGGGFSDSYWPADRMSEPFTWCRANDRDFIFDPGAGRWGQYPDLVKQWIGEPVPPAGA